MSPTLKPYQAAAVIELLARNGNAILLAAPGSGKTFIAFETAARLGVKRLLVLAPATIVSQLQAEAARYFERAIPYELRVTNYERLLTKDLAELIAWSPDMVICDEGERIKGATTRTYKALLKVPSKHRLVMSANVAPNALHEYWAPANYVRPGVAGRSFWDFRTRYCRLHPVFHGIVGYFDEPMVKKLLTRDVIRIDDSVVSLPELVSDVVKLDLSAEERVRYDEMRKTGIAEMQGEKVTINNALGLLLRLRQFADGSAAVAGSSAKLDWLRTNVSGPTIVFVDFVDVARKVAATIGGVCVTGEMKPDDRAVAFTAWRKEGGMLTMTATGALGLNLSEADTVVHASIPWNDSRVLQRVGRARRTTRLAPVREVTLIVRDTVDEKIYAMIGRKKRSLTFDEVMRIL